MDHHLEDTLNLESAMGSMDFDHSGPVESQEDIALETSGHEGDMAMEFEQIEEQPMLMDTGNEEIIVSDFINDQYTLQEYSIQDDQTAKASIEENELLSAQSESMVDLNFEPATIPQNIPQDVTTMPKMIAVKAPTSSTRLVKKTEIAAATMPKQVAIAPKPPKLVPVPRTYGKQLPIAPKPVTLVVNKSTGLKKTTVAGVLQGSVKSNAVLTQIGKQLLMMPTSGAQKIKLVSSGSGSIQYVRAKTDQQAAQLISTKNIIGTNPQKQTLTKVILRRDNQSDQPAVITKITTPTTSAGNQTRYIMQQKTVPISLAGNKVILTSPTKAPMKIAKKQILAMKSPAPKLMPATSQASIGSTKKVVLTSNPGQNVILKTTAPPKSAQVLKDGNVVVQAQRSQIHQINVPGKGIQYIRLITNSSPASQRVVAKSQAPPLAIPSKNFVLTDSKGNFIQMHAEKVTSSQPPPLVITGSVGANLTQVGNKLPKKLVRIAPAATKTGQLAMQLSSRPLQSLLAPLSPVEDQNSSVELEEVTVDPQMKLEPQGDEPDAEVETEQEEQHQEIDSKASLRALLEESAEDDMAGVTMDEVEVDFQRRQEPEAEESSSSEQQESNHRPDDHSLIVIPSSFQVKHESQVRVTSDSSIRLNESNYSNIESQPMMSYLSPIENLSALENDVANNMDMRPRKACNCTKSQCLKLYCDCFANGEFCNRCNCINCHNNLENEEMRQKAIRACLDRNPNAFRPKIGKTKSGGPEIVRRHNKGCNCKRSGCLKNYCECYEAKIACTAMCKCVGCRNVEETLERRRDALRMRDQRPDTTKRAPALPLPFKQPCSFMTSEVIEAVCQCLLAAAAEGGSETGDSTIEVEEPDPVRDVIEEFARCLQDIIGASHQSGALSPVHQGQA